MEHTCGKCGRQFRRKAELDRHTKRRNPCKPPAYTCERCGKGFASYQTVWRHKKTIHQRREQQIAGEAQNTAIFREADRLRAADRILELEAAYDDLVELPHKTMCELAERKAQDQQEAVEKAEKDRDNALQALAQEKQRIATLESQNEQLRESLATMQSAQQKSRKRRGKKK